MQKKRKRSTWVTVIAVAIIAAGYIAYKYAYLVYREYDYITQYEDVHGLQRSNPIFIDGVRVGEVSNIELDGNKLVTVTFSINKHTKIPRGSIAYIASNGILGEKMIFLEKGKGPGYYKHLDKLTGLYDTSVMDMADQIAPMVESAKYILNTADKNFSNFNRRIDNGLVEQTQKNVRSIERSMSSYREQSVAIGKQVGGIVDKLSGYRESSQNLSNKVQSLDTSIKSAEKTTASLAAQPYAGQLDTLKQTVQKANTSARKIADNKSVQKSLDSKKDYSEINQQLEDVNKDMQEMNKNPKGITLIGGGKD